MTMLPRNLTPSLQAACAALAMLMMLAGAPAARTAQSGENGNAAATAAFDPGYAAWNRVLGVCLVGDGVDYARAKAELPTLERALEEFAAVSREQFAAMSPRGRMALMANAHNAAAMARIARRWPVRSMAATALFPRSPRRIDDIRLAGRRWSLKGLADELMGPKYQDARAIFLLNWGERGCAPLPEMAVTEINVMDLMDRQARRVMQGQAWSRYEPLKDRVCITPLIKQYREQFDRDYTSVWVFLQRYLPDSQVPRVKARPPRLKFLRFDHGLNAAMASRSPASAPIEATPGTAEPQAPASAPASAPVS